MVRRQLKDSIEKIESVDDLRLFRKVFDSLTEHVALLDQDGTIVATNKSWHKFTKSNSPVQFLKPEGINYIKVTESAVGPHADEAQAVAKGLREILSGKIADFKIEYPCHSPTEKRWFLMCASPITTEDRIDGVVVSHIPITERRQAEDALRESQELFSNAFEYAAIGKALILPSGYFYKANKALCRHVGYTEDELRTKTFMDITYEEDLYTGMDLVRKVLSGEIRTFQTEKRYVSKSGTIVWATLSVSVVLDSERKPKYLISQILDISEKKKFEEELKLLATSDPLTGAPNRRHFFSKLNEELTRRKRLGTRICVGMIDIDKFKDINDTHGHSSGDDVLKSLVATLKDTLRETDTFGRIGGEEFAVILVQPDRESAFLVAERLRLILASTRVQSTGSTILFTVSIGLHMVQDDETLDDVMKSADTALYEAKGSGRNRVCLC